MVDIKVLDKIIKETISAIEKSQEQIYAIAESATIEYQNVKKDLEKVKIK